MQTEILMGMTIFPWWNRYLGYFWSAQWTVKWTNWAVVLKIRLVRSTVQNQTKIKYLVYVNRSGGRGEHSPFYLCNYLISVLLRYFFSLPVLEMQNIAVFPTQIMRTALLPSPHPEQNHGLVFPKPKYNLQFLFASCFQVRRVRLVAPHISMNKKGQNCADFMLIFAFLLEEVQNCVIIGTEFFSGTVCVCETDKIRQVGRAATALQ